MPSENNDPRLNELLESWRVTSNMPTGFHERVWQRIALAEATTPIARWRQWLGQVQALMARPQLAAGYVTLLLLLGFGLGWVRGQEKSVQVQERLSSRYVSVMDPYQSLTR
jgi:hypothetical protein